jgi:hypothetical protein
VKVLAHRRDKICGIVVCDVTLDLWTTNEGYQWYIGNTPTGPLFAWQEPVGRFPTATNGGYPDLDAAMAWGDTVSPFDL